MVIVTKVVILISLATSLITLMSATSSQLRWWCNQTPHPDHCFHSILRNHPHFTPKHASQLRKVTLQITLEQALSIRGRAGTQCHNESEMRVLSDCLKLLNSTIDNLNRTIEGLRASPTTCADIDAQTWLSAALTNIETCRSGSLDLNVAAKLISPIVSANLSQLVRNSLAVNAMFLHSQDNYTRAFPHWLFRKSTTLLTSSDLKTMANVVVAKDNSGDFRSIQAAIDAASKRKSPERFIIHVKKGVYRENIEVAASNNDIWLIGDGMRKTVVTGDRSVRKGYTTYSSATAGIDGMRFVGRGITFRNSAGPSEGQAVAVRSSSDLSVFYRCSFVGFQDTLLVHAQRQFFRECYIYGTVDFIFGNAAVVIQSSIIFVRKPQKGQVNVVTAQGRYDPFQITGISIQNSRIMPTRDLKRHLASFRTYLGRPWMKYSTTVIMTSYIDGFLDPAGWLTWRNTTIAIDTVFYAEYDNFGAGSLTSKRVKWKGFHVIDNPQVAARYTVSGFIAGQSWLPFTGVPFSAGL